MTRLSQEQENLLAAARVLPTEVRQEIAERLLESLDDDAGIDAACRNEAEPRIGQLDRNEVELIPGDKVMAELRARCE